jgi:hypothetical protein
MQNLYIVSLTQPNEGDSADRLEIQFVPNELSYKRDSKLSTIDVIGRENPLRHWSGGDTSLDLQLDFYTEAENRQDVMKKVRWLQSLTYKNEQGIVPRVKLVWGDMFLEEVWYIASLGIKLDNFHPQYNWIPCQALIDLSLQIYGQNREYTLENIRGLL